MQETQNQVAEPQSVVSTIVVDTTGGLGRKYYGSRSPSGESPVTKSRKTPNISTGGSYFFGDKSNKDVSGGGGGGSDKEAGSPKPKAWKSLVTKQLRKIQGGAGNTSPSAVAVVSGSIGVPLRFCVPVRNDLK